MSGNKRTGDRSEASNDDAVSRLIRLIGKERSSAKREQLRVKFTNLTKEVPPDDRAVLVDAFRAAAQESSEGYVGEAASPLLLSGLIHLGYQKSAASLFRVSAKQFDRCDFETMRDAIPDPVSATLWIRRARIGKKKLLKEIAAGAKQFYPTVWCEWFVKIAPVKSLLIFAPYAMDSGERLTNLAPAQEILKLIMRRDRRNVLTADIRHLAQGNERRLKCLLYACIQSPPASMAYAQAFGANLSGSGREILFSVMRGIIHDPDRKTASDGAKFAAHVFTAWAVCSDDDAGVSSEIADFSAEVWLRSREDVAKQMWIATAAATLADSILTSRGDISLGGATQFAYALREADKGADTRDALWSTAFNLGVREFGEEESVAEYDSKRHEDTVGGILPGESVLIIQRGWEFQGTVVVRALVRRP